MSEVGSAHRTSPSERSHQKIPDWLEELPISVPPAVPSAFAMTPAMWVQLFLLKKNLEKTS
jgi:hypothetical protein